MKWKFWEAEESAEPGAVVGPEPEPEPEADPEHEAEPEPEAEPGLDREPQTEPEPEVPAHISLTIDEAKGVIKEAGGDVIQVGFLASAYRRQLQEDPESAETAVSRKKLRELVGQRLKDRGLLASDGVLELRD